MTAGPYAIVRNPLYVGNWLLWTGFAFWSRLLWMVPVAWLIFLAQYRAIAAWEAAFIRSKYPGTYDEYARDRCAPGCRDGRHASRWHPSPLSIRGAKCSSANAER